MATPKKTPEEMYDISRDITDGFRRAIQPQLDARKYGLAAQNLGGLQVDLYFLALMQLRWGFAGLRETMDELDSLLPLFDTVFRELSMPWCFNTCRLDAHLRLNYLLDRPHIDSVHFHNWASGKDSVIGAHGDAGAANWNCTHKFEIAIESVLTERVVVSAPCEFPTAKRYASNATTYRNYLDLVNAIVLDRREQAQAKLAEGVKLYRKRARGDDGSGYEGYGFVEYLFDFQLTAMIEFARRAQGWDLVVDAPYANTYATVLRNAAAFREQNSRKG